MRASQLLVLLLAASLGVAASARRLSQAANPFLPPSSPLAAAAPPQPASSAPAGAPPTAPADGTATVDSVGDTQLDPACACSPDGMSGGRNTSTKG